MTFKTFLMSASLVSLLTTPALAQDTTTAADPAADPAATTMEPAAEPMATDTMADETMAEEPMTIAEMTVDQFIGLDVQSVDGEDVGEIDYVLRGPSGDEGRAVIGIGGFLGLGEYTVALPISAFDFNAEERLLVVNVSEEDLRNTPEFDESGVESVDGDILMAELMADEPMETDTGMTTDTTTSDAAPAPENDPATEEDADMDGDADSDASDTTTSGSN
ncbi:PRC-barrel domain-containing protein [Tropicibacter sp. S64]|uniref:PRC-barrel domain-containing protein n=1 Tax=Tropicibacter sp. S64 TaxID=3415122 RepID=UPI003C7D8F99